MGRPWWYDSYWQKDRRAIKRRRLPSRRAWVWIALVLLSLLLTASSTGFHPVAITWFVNFVSYLCRILAITILIRAILSWFILGRYNLLVLLLYDVTEPVLSPLRRVIPRLGMFDITPIIAIAILYVIPVIITVVLT